MPGYQAKVFPHEGAGVCVWGGGGAAWKAIGPSLLQGQEEAKAKSTWISSLWLHMAGLSGGGGRSGL